MATSYYAPLLAGLLAGAVTTFGVLVIRRRREWGRRNADYAAYFAAGVLVSVSFLHLIPLAIDLNPHAPVWLLAGYFSLYLFNRFVTAHVCERDPSGDASLGVVAMFGIGFHSFVDGIVYSATFAVDLFTGVVAAAGMVLHEFPEGVVTYLLLLRGGFSERRATWLALAAAAFTTPAGVAASLPVVSRIGPDTLSALLALSAGSLVYVGATHLLPQAEAQRRRYSVAVLAAGVLTGTAIALSG